jgi:hypothetical protein
MPSATWAVIGQGCDPERGQIAAIILRGGADLFGHLLRGGVDDEVGRAVISAQGKKRGHRDDGPQEASFHAHVSS